MSLGKAIVALYVITFLTAIISARTLADRQLDQAKIPVIDSQSPRPASSID